MVQQATVIASGPAEATTAPEGGAATYSNPGVSNSLKLNAASSSDAGAANPTGPGDAITSTSSGTTSNPVASTSSSNGAETPSSPHDVTPSSPGNAIFSSIGEATTSDSGDATTLNSGDTTTLNSGEATTSNSGDYTISNSVHATTSNLADVSKSNPGDATTSNPGDATTWSSGDATTSNHSDATTPNLGGATTSSSGDATTSNPSNATTSNLADVTKSNPGDGSTSNPSDAIAPISGVATVWNPGDATTSNAGDATPNSSEAITSNSGVATTSKPSDATTSNPSASISLNPSADTPLTPRDTTLSKPCTATSSNPSAGNLSCPRVATSSNRSAVIASYHRPTTSLKPGAGTLSNASDTLVNPGAATFLRPGAATPSNLRAVTSMKLGGAPLSVPLERKYVIQANTSMQLVNHFVPPVHTMFRIPNFETPEQVIASTGSGHGIRGRRRGRPPLGSRPSGVTPRRPYKRKRKEVSPPPLPPVPNYLAHVINPLVNEIYPKVIVQRVGEPWAIPKTVKKEPMPPPPTPPPPPPPPSAAAIPVSSMSGSTMTDAKLRESLKLFGPDVTVRKVTSHGQSRFLAVRKEPNGEQRHILFSASQLLAFTGMHPVTQLGPPPLSLQKPTPPGVIRLRPGPTPGRPKPVAPPQPPPPPLPRRVPIELPPNFKLPTMAALRAAAARESSWEAPSTSKGLRVGARAPPVVKVPAGAKAGAAQRGPVTKAEPQKMVAPTKIEPIPSPSPARPPTPPPPPPPPPSPDRSSLSRLPLILTRKSQMRLLQEKAKRAAEKVSVDAKKLCLRLEELEKTTGDKE